MALQGFVGTGGDVGAVDLGGPGKMIVDPNGVEAERLGFLGDSEMDSGTQAELNPVAEGDLP
jgi:hypothetical protein